MVFVASNHFVLTFAVELKWICRRVFARAHSHSLNNVRFILSGIGVRLVVWLFRLTIFCHSWRLCIAANAIAIDSVITTKAPSNGYLVSKTHGSLPSQIVIGAAAAAATVVVVVVVVVL